MALRTLLGRQRRPKIKVVGPDQRDGLRPNQGGVVARLASLLGDQRRRAAIVIGPRQPNDRA